MIKDKYPNSGSHHYNGILITPDSIGFITGHFHSVN